MYEHEFRVQRITAVGEIIGCQNYSLRSLAIYFARAKVGGKLIRQAEWLDRSGIVRSSTAKAFNRKDGSGKDGGIRHELELQPDLAVFEEYPRRPR